MNNVKVTDVTDVIDVFHRFGFAYYYLGSAYRDLKDYPRAVNHFLMAVDAARQSKCADTLIWQNTKASDERGVQLFH